jgi:TM2 domain-containing membrane protein YozV
MALDTAQLQLIEQRVANDGPNMVLAYVLWLFLGILGAHRFYLGRVGSGVVMLVLSITFFGLIITGVWWLVDAFLTAGMVQKKREDLRQKLMTEMMAYSHTPVAAQPISTAALPST